MFSFKRFLSTVRKDNTGTSTLEFVVVMPIFLLITSFIITFFQYTLAENVSFFSAFDGARKTMALTGTTDMGKQSALETLTVLPLIVNGSNVDCSKDESVSSCKVTVDVKYFFDIVGLNTVVHNTVVLPTEKPPEGFDD